MAKVNFPTTQERFSVPIAIFLFNRPNELRSVLKVIEEIKPTTLFLIADGPRVDHPEDQELCMHARMICSEINWPCQTHRLFFDINQSNRNAIPLGLDWVFSKVDQCIILEDDCVPSHSFFFYCAELLERFRDTPQIMTIGGHRFDGPDEYHQDSYFFSKYPSTWGWATWKRAWKLFDLNLEKWTALKKTNWLYELLSNTRYENYWSRIFNQMQAGLNTWDYALLFSCWSNHGLSIRSKVNMIHNIGHNNSATHTRSLNPLITERKAMEIHFPLQHPSIITCNQATEERIEWVSYSGITQRAIEAAYSKIQSQVSTKKTN